MSFLRGFLGIPRPESETRFSFGNVGLFSTSFDHLRPNTLDLGAFWANQRVSFLQQAESVILTFKSTTHSDTEQAQHASCSHHSAQVLLTLTRCHLPCFAGPLKSWTRHAALTSRPKSCPIQTTRRPRSVRTASPSSQPRSRRTCPLHPRQGGSEKPPPMTHP